MDVLHIGKSKYKLVRIIEDKFKDDISGHTHGAQSYEIHYCTQGSGELVTESDTYPLSKNVLYITGPDIWHRQLVNKKDPLSEICLNIQILTSGNDILSKNFNSTHFWIGKANEQLQKFYSFLNEMLSNNSIYSREVQIHIAELIITELSHTYSANLVQASKYTPDDKKFIIIDEAFIYDYASITIEELSNRIGLSLRQTQRILKQYYGVTFREKCVKSRLEAAYMLLKQGKSVNQVAYEVGYSDTPSFIRAFKKQYDKTPSKILNKK